MEKIITYETLRNFAYSNDKLIKSPVRGIVLHFFGLGNTTMMSEDTPEAVGYAEKGILYIVPYNNPWCWMNRQAVDYTDEIVRVILKHYDLPESTCIISSGGSMGGLSSLVYCKYAKLTPAACVANCPVCDLPYHYTERPDLPRTLYGAFGTYPGTMKDAMESASPLHLADQMPDIDYHIFHCDEDKAVNIDKHSEAFLGRMKELGRNIEYYIVHGQGHCLLTPEMWDRYYKIIYDKIEEANG